jgi:L-malate glycosyltransferase
MRLVVAGPVETARLSTYLDLDGKIVPRGLNGTPVPTLVASLVESGAHVTVVSLAPEVPPGSEIVLGGSQLLVRYGHYRPRYRARDAFREERGYVRDAILSESPDLVHAHWQYEFALGALSSGVPTLVTCHDWAPTVLRQMPQAYRAVRLGMQAATLRRARHLTAVSPSLRDRVSRWTKGWVEVVPNSVPASFFTDLPRVRSERADRLIAINQGFSRLKNVSTLLRAFRVIRRQRPGASLALVGTGYESDGPAAAWARRNDLSSGVTFWGPVDYEAVPSCLAEADILVHPSRSEACPMVLIEAMAQGLPVVGGERSGGVPWVLDHGRAGSLTDIGSPAGVAGAVLMLMEDPDRWADLSAAATARAKALSHPNTVLASYRACYDRVLTQDPAHR